MADTDILRAYLIKIGFKVDEASQKKANATTAEIGKTISALGKVAAAAAVAFVAGVNKMANELDGLYWASKRTGASAGNIKAMGFAASQLGSSADASAASLANFARLLKTKPGSEGVFKDLGIQARDANGKLRDTSDLMVEFGQALSKKDYALANQYAEFFGIDETMLNAIMDPAYAQKIAEQKQAMRDAGLDMERAAEVANKYELALGKIKMRLEGIALSVADKALPGFLAFIDGVDKSLASLMSWAGKFTSISEAVSNLMGGKAGAKPGEKPKSFFDWLVTPLSGTENGLGRPGAAAAAGARVGTEKGRGGASSGGLASSPFAALIARGEGDYNTVNRGKAHGYKAGTEDLAGMTIAEVLAAQKEGKFKAAGRYQMIPGTLESGMKALSMSGSEKFDKATQDRLFEGYLAGSKRPAIMDYLSGKSGDVKAAILAVSQEWASVANPLTGKSFYAGDGVNKASISVEEMTRALEQTKSRYALGATGGPQITQTTTITVNGAGDARDTASAVSGALTGVNQSLVRNMTPRVM